MKKGKICVCMGLFLLLLTGCHGNDARALTPETVPATTTIVDGVVIYSQEPLLAPDKVLRTEYNVREMSMEEVVSETTHIVDAEFLGFYPRSRSNELVFRVASIYKGAFAEKNEVIFVQELRSNYRLDPGQEAVYEVGQKYMLFLEKYSSVYYEHDKYVQLGQVYMPETDKDWESTHSETEKILSALTGTDSIKDQFSQYGSPYTTSTKIVDALDVADSVFVIRVDSVFDEGLDTSTTAYFCSVTKTVTNTPLNNGNLIIPFFDGTVEVGQEYLVLLCKTGEKSEIYNLASPNSVFTLTEAAQQAELASLVENAAEYKTIPMERGSFVEELEKELEAMKEAEKTGN